MGRDRFRDLNRRLTRARWEMARVRDCWGALECNHGSTCVSPLAAQKASGVADRRAFSGRNSRKRSLDRTKYVPHEESLVA